MLLFAWPLINIGLPGRIMLKNSIKMVLKVDEIAKIRQYKIN